MSFIAVDYETLEWKAMAGAKTANFGGPGGLKPGFGRPGACGEYRCARCGLQLFGYHDRRRCNYAATSQRYQRQGYVPVTGLLKKALKQAGIPVHWGTGLIAPEGPRIANLRRRGSKPKDPNPALQKTYYAPVWAVLLYDMSGIGSLTSPKRPKVKELMARLRHAMNDPDEVSILMTEHVLGNGPYIIACQALLGRSKR